MIRIPNFTYLLKQVAPHLSKDTTTPVLCGIHLEVDGRTLYAAATDRYTIAIARHHDQDVTPAPAEHWNATLTRADLKAVNALTPAWRGEAHTLTHDGTGLIIELGGRTIALHGEDHPGTFPKWRPLLRSAMDSGPHLTDDLALNPAYLARWGSALHGEDRYTPLTVWTAGPTKPLVIARGPNFIGLQMPVINPAKGTSLPTRDTIRAAWATTLATPPAALRAAA